MKVLLRADIKGIGRRGDIVQVLIEFSSVEDEECSSPSMCPPCSDFEASGDN